MTPSMASLAHLAPFRPHEISLDVWSLIPLDPTDKFVLRTGLELRINQRPLSVEVVDLGSN